jgi:hypothetical protein
MPQSILLETEQWMGMTNEIQRGCCNVQRLILTLHGGATSDLSEGSKTLASALQLDPNLQDLTLLQMDIGFTDEAGLALTKALTVKITLRMITLSETTLSIQAYHAACKSQALF